jgi:transposase InsO family protein
MIAPLRLYSRRAGNFDQRQPRCSWLAEVYSVLRNRQTATDHASRFLLLCDALDSTREETALTAFERLFRERGLPLAIRSDNGVPFASPNALFNLSKLSVWWPRLGIAIERIEPGHPQQNGRHERCPHAQEGSNPAAGLQQPAAPGALRCFRARVQR